MKNKLTAFLLCAVFSISAIGCGTKEKDIYSDNKDSITKLNTAWEDTNSDYYGNEDYTYSPVEGLTVQTINEHENNISEVEFTLGENIFRTIFPTDLLHSQMSYSEIHDYEQNGTYDFIIADTSQKMMYWFGFVPNSINGITSDSLKTLTQASLDDFTVPSGYEVNDDYERFFIDNEDYFGIIMECDNMGVSESDEISADSMHGYYIQLYDKTSYDYIAQFIGGTDISEDLLNSIRLSGWCMRLKH